MLGSTPPVGSANVLPELPPSPPPQGSARTGAIKQNTGIAPSAGGETGEGSSAQASGSKQSSVSNVFAEATQKGQKQEANTSNPNSHAKPIDLYSADAQSVLRNAERVVVAGFSSQGGGHTERMFMPLDEANIGKGNAVVLVLPPHWQYDEGNEKKMLDEYSDKLKAQDINVITVQADKSVWGYYKENGPSDNFGILKEFSDKPNRNNSQTPLFGKQSEPGQGHKHSDIMSKIVEAAGDKGKITVFEDMDPYLAKAAAKADIPRSHIVGQSNHLTQLDAERANYFQGKSDAFLVKVNGNGHIGKVATIELDANINTTRKLGKSLESFNWVANGDDWRRDDEGKIQAEHKAVDVRKRMLKLLLAKGNKHDLDSNAAVTRSGCVMVSPQANAESIDRGVYIYLNKYTNPLAQHVRERLNSNDDTPLTQAYKKTAFLFCGTEAFQADAKVNAMHVGQMANFDGISSAGFGTTSEMHYLMMNDAHQGNLIMMPIEHQHEQEANAEFLLPEALGDRRDRVDTAKNMDDLKIALDDLILNKATTDEKLGESTMEALFNATREDETRPKGTDKAVSRLNGGEMNEKESRLLNENTARAMDANRKALRRLNKVMMPALTALSEGKIITSLRMTAADQPKSISLPELIQTLRDPKKAGALMNADFSGAMANTQREKCVEWLERLMQEPPGDVRKQAASEFMRGEYANNTYILGY